MRAGWRFGVLVSATLRGHKAGMARTIALAIASAVLAALVVYLELATVGGALQFRSRSLAAGAGVAIVKADADMSAATCEAISDNLGVVNSGGLSRDTAVEVVTAPGVLLQKVAVTDGLLGLWGMDPSSVTASPAGGWLIGSDLSDELDIRVGDHLAVQGGNDAAVDAIVQRGPLTDTGARWLVEIVPPLGTIDECWVSFESAATITDLGALTSVFAANDSLSVRPFLRPDALSRDTRREILERPSRWGWLAFVVALSLVHYLVWRSRRNERALYSVVGTNRFEHLLRAQLDVAILTAVPSYVGAVTAIAAWTTATGATGAGTRPIVGALTTLSLGIGSLSLAAPLLAVPRRISGLIDELRAV